LTARRVRSNPVNVPDDGSDRWQLTPLEGELIVEDSPVGRVAVYTRADPTQQERASQDRVAAWLLGDQRLVLALADGAGGHAAGGDAATDALKALHATLKERVRAGDEDLIAGVLEGFERANQAVRDMRNGAGTTLTMALVDGETLRTFHVGDSMSLAVGQRGRVRMQTLPHSPVAYAVEAGMLEAEEAIHHDDRHVVSNLVGTPDMHISVGAPLRLRPYDTLVIASDGLWDNLQEDEVVSEVRKGTLLRAGRALAESCTQRMLAPRPDEPSKPDDLSVVLFRRGKSGGRSRRKRKA
jgi:serine/threonine protein phosphatase PrpC